MDDIKSARELAMEKVAAMEAPTEEERLRWKYTPAGEKLAARYLKEDCNLATELGNYDETVRLYVAGGAAGILIRNIDLPVSDAARRQNKRAMDGVKVLKQDKVAVENVFSAMRRVFDFNPTALNIQHRRVARIRA